MKFVRAFTSYIQPREVCIIASSRSPTGQYNGVFRSTTAVDLGKQTIEGLLRKYPIAGEAIQSSYLGIYYYLDIGPSPIKQISESTDLSTSMNCTYINKLCASGMKAVLLGAMEILSGVSDVVLVGGMEHLTAEHIFLSKESAKAKVTNIFKCKIEDKMLGGIADSYAMAEGYTREEQDNYCMSSYERALNAKEKQLFKDDIVPITLADGVVEQDEIRDVTKTLRTIRPAFNRNGTVTSITTGPFGDGASFLVLSTREKAKEMGADVIATIDSFAEFEYTSKDFIDAHIPTMDLNFKRSKLKLEDIELFEICETFSLVPLASMRKQNIDRDIMNVHGGDLAYGHIVGMTGVRMIQTLITSMKLQGKSNGMAAMPSACGGGTSLIIRR